MNSERAQPAPAGQEFVVAKFRSHGRRLVWPALLFIALAAGVPLAAGTFDENWEILLLLSGSIALMMLGCALPYIAWLGERTIITTRRLVIRRGLVTRLHQELLHSRGYDVTVQQGLFQRPFGSGDVRINAGIDQPVVLRDVPNALLVAEVLQDLMESNANPIASRRQSFEARATQPTTILPQ